MRVSILEHGFRASLAILSALLMVLFAPMVAAQPYEAEVSVGNPFKPGESMHDCSDPANPLVNCGFEDGNFNGWVTQDLTVPFLPLAVGPGGVTPGFGLFVSAPTEGVFAALHGFDGDGPGTIIIAQDVTIPSGATLVFDYRAGWDMFNFGGSTVDRTFSVEIEPAGGGGALQSDLILTAPAGTVDLDTGPLSANVDLGAFAGQTVRVSFEWFVPEFFTGPAFFQLDNVLIASGVPTLPTAALLLLALILIAGARFLLLRRPGRV